MSNILTNYLTSLSIWKSYKREKALFMHITISFWLYNSYWSIGLIISAISNSLVVWHLCFLVNNFHLSGSTPLLLSIYKREALCLGSKYFSFLNLTHFPLTFEVFILKKKECLKCVELELQTVWIHDCGFGGKPNIFLSQLDYDFSTLLWQTPHTTCTYAFP